MTLVISMFLIIFLLFFFFIHRNAYNRAKAAQMFPQEVLDIHKYSHLFKGHHYEYEPKGLWRDIVSGVRGQMINFYESWYRPNNAKAFCYGRGDYINACLDILDEAITSFDTDKEAFDSTIPFLKLDDITGNLLMRQSYPSFEEDKDYRLAVSWVLNDEAMDSRTEVSWFLIKELLIGSATSIISKVLEPFGDDFIGSLDSNLQQWVLTMGASGLAHEHDAEKAQNAMNQALNLISQNGFEKETLKAAMNKVEFQLRDLNSKCGVPQGVKMFKDILTKWNYDLDPKLALDWYTEFVELKKELEDPDNTEAEEALIELVTKFLITSKAKSSVILSPSSTMQQQARNDEIEWLNDSPNVWSQQQGNEILGETTELHKEQERGDSPMDLAKLPRLSIEDIEDEPFDETKMVIREDVFSSGVTLIENEVADSNGIGYVDFALDLSLLKFDDVILIPLLCRLMVESGISFQTDVEMQNKIDTYTGGLTIEPIVEEVYEFKDKTGGYMVDSGRHMVTKIVVRSSVFADKHPAELFSIIKQVIWDSDIDDQEKTINILQDMIDDMEDNIQRHGHDFATRRIEARYSLPCFIREQWFGVTQLFKARNALQVAKENWDDFIVRLLQMQDAVKRIHHSGMLMSITGDKKTIKNLAGSSSVFFQDLLPKSAQKEPFPDFGKVDHPWVKTGNDAMNKNFEVESPFSAFLVPTLVNDVTKGGLLYEVGDHISGAHIAAAHYLSGFYMNDKIRFNLGAQEAWARLDLDSGVMVYQSEGVPDINPIIDIFDEAPTWVQGQMSGIEYLPLEAEAAIVSAIGKMDGSRLQANQIGYVSLIRYIKQDKKEARQQWRDEALGATRHDFTDFVSKIGGWLNPSICAITNRNMLDIARDKMQQNLTACSITGYSCP